MSCKPFNPSQGPFITDRDWDSASNFGTWSFALDAANTSVNRYNLKSGAVTQDTILVEDGSAIAWVWYVNFLLVRIGTPSGGLVSYRMYVYDLRSGSAVKNSVDQAVTTLTANHDAAINFQHSPDGLGFFLFASNGIANQTIWNSVYRSDTGERICGINFIDTTAQDNGERGAYFTGNQTIRIVTRLLSSDEHIEQECQLRIGQLSVTPHCPTFPEVIIGSGPGCGTSVLQFILQNVGSGELCISGIEQPASPFSITSITPSIPAGGELSLQPGGRAIVVVSFTPTAVGQTPETHLHIAAEPAGGDTEICFKGVARAPSKRLRDIPPVLDFGDICVGQCATKHLTFTNAGSSCDDAVNVTVPSSPAGSHFTWQGIASQSIEPGNSQTLDIQYCPTQERNETFTIVVTSDDPAGHHDIQVTGSGCEPHPIMVTDPPDGGTLDFGEIEQGLIWRRAIKVSNPGNGLLTFTACTTGGEFTLFNQEDPNSMGFNGPLCRDYSIHPVQPCCDDEVGTGEVNVNIIFHANDLTNGGVHTAAVTIEAPNLNDPNTNMPPLVVRINLRGKVIPATPLDAAIVIERSNTMSDSIGSTTRIEAAIQAARLFVRLARPIAHDRISLVKFSDRPDVLHPNTEITSVDNQRDLASALVPDNLNPDGATCIAGGTWLGTDQLQENSPRKALILLTTGADNTAYQRPVYNSFDLRYPFSWYSLRGGWSHLPESQRPLLTHAMPLLHDVQYYVVQLGQGTPYDTQQLDRLTYGYNGAFQLTDTLDGENFFDLAKYYARVFMGLSTTQVISDPYIEIDAEARSIKFQIEPGDVSLLVVIFDRVDQRVPFVLSTPLGEDIDAPIGQYPSVFAVRVGATQTSRFVEVSLPAGLSEKYAGAWSVKFLPGGMVYGDSSSDNQKWSPGFVPPTKSSKPGVPVGLGYMLGVKSNYQMKSWLTPAAVYVGDEILVSVQLTEAGIPVIGADVNVEVVSPAGNVFSLRLLDDGANSDQDSKDGIYAAIFRHTVEPGVYQFKIRALRINGRGQTISREAQLAKYVAKSPAPDEPQPGSQAIERPTRADRLRDFVLLATAVLLLALIIILLFRR